MMKPSRKSKKRLAKGMFMRGKVYYVRFRQDGRDTARSLGSDYATAMLRYAEYRANGLTSPAPRLTVADVAERWLAERIANGRNQKGQQLARVRAEKYLRPFIGTKLLDQVTRSDFANYRVWLEKRCRSLTTVRWVLGDARSLFRWCVGEGPLAAAPIPDKLLPRLQERAPDRLTDDEVAKVLAIPEPWAFVVRLGLGTGLRWAEMCRAQASDVQDGLLVVQQTKSRKVRRVPLSPELLHELRSRVGRLVPYAVGSPGSFANIVRRHSGVSRFHVHQLRHSMACRWLERGGSLAALQEILGHASILTTQRYARLSEEHVRAEADRVARVG